MVVQVINLILTLRKKQDMLDKHTIHYIQIKIIKQLYHINNHIEYINMTLNN